MSIVAGMEMRLYKTPLFFIVGGSQVRKNAGETADLVIDRRSRTFEVKNAFNPLQYGVRKDQVLYQDFRCMLGVTRYGESHFLLIATRTEQVATVFTCPVFEIREAEVIPMQPDITQQDALDYAVRLSGNRAREDPFTSLYCWNEYYCRPLKAEICARWLTPVIRGFVGSVSRDLSIEVTLVSREAQTKCGYLAGLKENGDVAHMVETEVLSQLQGERYSFVQLGATAPVLWSWKNEQFYIMPSKQKNADALTKHLSLILAQYESVQLLNLLSQTFPNERDITSVLQSAISALDQSYQSRLSYRWLNFGESNQSEVQQAIKDLIPEFKRMRYTAFDAEGRLKSTQCEVARINCFDCLSRTNSVMKYIARVVVENQVKSAACALPEDFAEAFAGLWRQNLSSLRAVRASDFEVVPSLHSDDPSRLIVKVCSWNLAGLKPPVAMNLAEWLIKEHPFPHVLVVGLQEIVKLSAMNTLELVKNEEVEQVWVQLLLTTINKQASRNYVHIASERLVGCFISVFVVEKYAQYVTGVAKDRVKVGFRNNLGNKGAVAIRFALLGSTYCFVNCHLESGVDKSELRIKQMAEILLRSLQAHELTVLGHDKIFLFGDLNFRFNLSGEEVEQALRTVNYDRLRQFDQLTLQHSIGDPVLSLFSEPEINFVPTYKYNLQDNLFNLTRVPAWTDRVLYKGELQTLGYRRCDIPYSDHRPISFTASLSFLRSLLTPSLRALAEQSLPAF